MSVIRVNLTEPIADGMTVIFKAPCDCSGVTGMKVYYPGVSGNASRSFTFVDADGGNLTKCGAEPFTAEAYVSVVLNVSSGLAYVINGLTNSYLEDRLDGKLSTSGGTISGNLTHNGQFILSSDTYGDSLPSAGNKGRLFFKKA